MHFRSALIFSIFAALGLVVPALSAGPLSAGDKEFLAGYEKIRSALAADDLNAAKQAAANLSDTGAAAGKSNSLQEARTSFESLSQRAETLVAGQPGYYLVYCPMVRKSWIQTSDKIDNPYMGKKMAECGVVKSNVK
jgi:hypothetical protein